MTFEEIRDDVVRQLKEQMPDAAYDAAFEIQSLYEKAIDKFYDFQTKGTYDRNYNLYLGSNLGAMNSDISGGFEMINGGTGFKAGIHVSPKGLGKPYKDPTYYVFMGAYARGIHGTTETGGVGDVPMHLMDEWFAEFKSNIGSFLDKRLRINAKIN